MNTKDQELSICLINIKPMDERHHCQHCGQFIPSPWRSLKNDPPDYPPPLGTSILLRRGMDYSGTTQRRWYQHKVMDAPTERVLKHGWKEWMEVPE